jgi:hypothetical protein
MGRPSLGTIHFSTPTGDRQQKRRLSRGALSRRPAWLTGNSRLCSKLVSILPDNGGSRFKPNADAAVRVDKRALGDDATDHIFGGHGLGWWAAGHRNGSSGANQIDDAL